MTEITTCEAFLAALISTDETEFMLINDLNFADIGQIVSTHTKINTNNIIIDLNEHEITNLYPLFCDVLVQNAGKVTIQNGSITNLLCSDGHFVDIPTDAVAPGMPTYARVFEKLSTDFKIRFVNVGFSILGCNYDYQKSKTNTGMIRSANLNSSYVHTSVVFDRCSFYIRTINSIPLINHAVFKNCSFEFDDCEYSDLNYDVMSYQTSGVVSHAVYFFCVIRGKISKSEIFDRSGQYSRKVMGELINCYVDLDTDIENLFVNVSINAYPSNLNSLLKDPFTATSDSNIGHDTVYNRERWHGEEGTNFIIGGQGITSEQMHDADYLMRCGFLAIDEDDE